MTFMLLCDMYFQDDMKKFIKRGVFTMRTEQEMYDLIINTAKKDERIRAVYMNGSRTNVNAPKDILQDYDIVYVVTETRPFYENKSWIDCFGERLYMQCPDECDKSMGLEWERFLQTYGGTTSEQVWNSVMIMCGLMDEIAPEVGEKLGFQYNYTEAKNSRYYLGQVRYLPANATQIF